MLLEPPAAPPSAVAPVPPPLPPSAPGPAPTPAALAATAFGAAARGVLVGVDGSDGSLWALDRAFVEAEALALPLHLLSAVNPSPRGGYAAGMDELAEEGAERLRLGMRAVAERAMAAVAARHRGAPAPALHVLLGDPIDILLAASARHHTLVVGARGNGGFSRLLLGSVSTALVHHAACPVLLVPAQAIAAPGNTSTGPPVALSDPEDRRSAKP